SGLLIGGFPVEEEIYPIKRNNNIIGLLRIQKNLLVHSEFPYNARSYKETCQWLVKNLIKFNLNWRGYNEPLSDGEGILILDKDGIVLFANMAAVRLFRTIGEMSNIWGRKIKDSIFYKYIENYQETGALRVYGEETYEEYNEETRSFFKRLFPLTKGDNNLWRVFYVIRETTELRQKERELRFKSVLIKEFVQSSEELGYYRGDVRINSVMIAPVLILDRVEGIFVVDRRGDGFTDEDKILFDEATKGIGFLISMLRLYEKERYESKYLSSIAELARRLQRGLELKTIVSDTVRSFKAVLNCDELSIASVDELNNQGTVLESTYLKENTKFGLDEGLVGLVVRHRNYIMKEDLSEGNLIVLKKGEKKNRGSFLGVPVKGDNEVLGVIWLEDHRRKRFGEEDVEALHILASQLTLAWQRAILYERVKELSIRDGLTGLYNHRHFQELLEQEIKKQKEFVLMLFDIDYFKKINDTYGHQAGDEVLKFIGRLISQTGIAGRYGGEEFAIILPNSNLKKGVEIAVRLKDHINKSEVLFNQVKIKFTISVGIAHYPKDAKNRVDLIEQADRALYSAKETGRNKIVIAKSLNEKKSNN
ncbi:MAG: sensor domain-containing diguanylate cyclase, partial [candidate division WOR-3 bacterium]